MRTLLALVLLLTGPVTLPSSASACERHLHGHQTSSDTGREGLRR